MYKCTPNKSLQPTAQLRRRRPAVDLERYAQIVVLVSD